MSKRQLSRWAILSIAAALALWGALVGFGAYWGGLRFGYNPLRGVVVAAAVLAFVLFWWALLAARRRQR